MTAPRTDYAERIARAIALIERAIANQADMPDLAELASVAHFSPFHFHRIYRALTGEAIGQTIARLRQLRALRLLQQPELDVTEVALAVGYGTSQAFARAFRQALGSSPSDLRAQPQRIEREIVLRATPPPNAAVNGAALRVEVVSVEPFRVLAMRNVGDFAELDQAFDRFFAWVAEHGAVDAIRGLYGIPRCDPRETPASEQVFDCALGFIELPAPAPERGIAALTLDGGRYAVVRHVGAFSGVEATLDRTLAGWLPGSGECLRDVPIHHHYLDDPADVAEAELRTDIYVPLV